MVTISYSNLWSQSVRTYLKLMRKSYDMKPEHLLYLYKNGCPRNKNYYSTKVNNWIKKYLKYFYIQ